MASVQIIDAHESGELAVEQELCTKGEVIKDQWEVLQKFSVGGFSQIYLVKECDTKLIAVLKVELAKTTKVQIPTEILIMKKYQAMPHGIKLLDYGMEAERNFIVMQLVGKNLSDLRQMSPTANRRFSGNTVMRLMEQCVEAIRDLHALDVIHRDIKPANFAMGTELTNKNVVHLLDFGLARFYRDSQGIIRRPRPVAGIRGTLKYCSVTTLRREELGRKDDLISLFYVFIDLYTGLLPWRTLKRQEDVMAQKDKYDLNWLAQRMPKTIQKFAAYIHSLRYADEPDYTMLLKLIKTVITDNKIKSTDPWDWENDFEFTIDMKLR